MRKRFGSARRAEPVEGNQHSKNHKHGRGRPCLRWLALVLLFGTASALVWGQDVNLGSGSKPGGREQRALQERWILRGRSSPGQSGALQRYGAYLQKMRMRAERKARVQKEKSDSAPAAALVWTSLGPAPLASDASSTGEFNYSWVSGRATAVAIDPADPTGNTVYIGGAYGGVWKSTNAGPASLSPANVAWQPLTDNQATLAVGAIAIQPGNTNPNNSVILVGTGEANSSADSYYGLGILRSPNAGTTWTLISSDTTTTRSFAGMAFSKIAFSSNSSNIAVAATAGASEGIIEGLANPLTANLGLYYSSDSGKSWTYADVSDGSAATAPGSATSVVYNASAGTFFAALRYHGFYSSADSIHWTRLANQPGNGLTATACPANPGSSSCPIYRGELAVVPGRNEMYVWYVDANDFDQGIWTSLDGGNSWTQINDAGIINCDDQFGCGTEQGAYNLELAAVPNGNSGVTDLYAGAINLYKCEIISTSPSCSGTGSNTFLNLTHAYGCSSIAMVHPAQHSVSFLVNTSTQDVMYFANDGGIYRALNGYADLTTGTCGGANQFDSLNLTLGSMSQFVAFSQASSDANTILGERKVMAPRAHSRRRRPARLGEV
jgi:large repetitive protein